MGAYMSEPDTTKHSEEYTYKNLQIGVSGMQGWRMSMEDAHCCVTNFDDKGSSLFGVFDGHGGKEVADYCAQNLHRFILDSESYQEGDIKKALKESFLNIDEALTTEEVIQELKGLQNDMGGDDEDEDEAALLLEEANMPLGDLLERLKNSAQDQLNNGENGDDKATNGHDTLENGTANGENGEGGKQKSSRKQKKPVKRNVDEIQTDVSVGGGAGASAPTEDLAVQGVAMNIGSAPAGAVGGGSSAGVATGGVSASSSSTSTAAMLDGPLLESDGDPDYQVGEEEEEEDSGDEDDDDEGDDDEDDFDDDEFEDPDGVDFQAGSDEVGKDSGTTAICALIQGNNLYVANVGDSRCVLCRAGKAVELSTDHKPEDEVELARIEKAGAKVTENGRVNGGLNLSRALGDHVYKMNKELSAEDQAITANPELREMELRKEDEFMVLACDGIWNVMTSEEVVAHVKSRLDGDGNAAEEKISLTAICEELFDMCMAPDTKNDGSGCDNMTCMIVKLQMNDVIKDEINNSSKKRPTTQANGNHDNDTNGDDASNNAKKVKLGDD